MNIGAVFPHQEIGDDPVMIRDWAQAVEDLGYSHILAYDHVIRAVHEDRDPKLWGPYTEEDAFHELFVLFGFFAAFMLDAEDCVGRHEYSFALNLYLEALALFEAVCKASQFGHCLLGSVGFFDVSFGFFPGHGCSSSQMVK